jgi:hypothetical protein
MILNTNRETLNGFIAKVVSPNVELLTTDEHPAYARLNQLYPYEVIQHRDEVYVRGVVHTNNIEPRFPFSQ